MVGLYYSLAIFYAMRYYIAYKNEFIYVCSIV